MCDNHIDRVRASQPAASRDGCCDHCRLLMSTGSAGWLGCVCLCACLPVHVDVQLYVYVYVYVYLSASESVSACVCVFVCLAVSLGHRSLSFAVCVRVPMCAGACVRLFVRAYTRGGLFTRVDLFARVDLFDFCILASTTCFHRGFTACSCAFSGTILRAILLSRCPRHTRPRHSSTSTAQMARPASAPPGPLLHPLCTALF